MSDIQRILGDFEQEVFSLRKLYSETVDPTVKASIAKEMEELNEKLEKLEPDVINYLSSDDINSEQTKIVSEEYVELQDHFERFNRDHWAATHDRYTIDPRALAPPISTNNPANTLNASIEELRSELEEINRAVNMASDATMVSTEQIQAERAIEDASILAVAQVKHQTEMQNKQLHSELEMLREQLETTIDENIMLREKNTKLQTEIDELEQQNREHERNAERLQNERQYNKEDLQILVEEKERCKDRLKTINQMYEFEEKKNEAFRRENKERLSELEADNNALQANNVALRQKIEDMEKLDIENAAIDIDRATKTIQLLTRQVDELKSKLLEQKEADATKFEELKATIVTLNDGDINDTMEIYKMKEELDGVKQYNEELAATVKSLQSKESELFATNPNLAQLKLVDHNTIGQNTGK